MTIPDFAFNVLVLAVLGFELHRNSRERQSLALLIKSRDVQEFVRAEASLAKPEPDKKPADPTSVDLDIADPAEVAGHLK